MQLDEAKIPMERTHPGGLFTAHLENEPGAYKLNVTDRQGTVAELEDPYRFPPVLSDFDLHLHSEGTNYEGYNSFGAHLVTVNGVAGTQIRSLGSERAHCQRRGRFQWLGHPPPSHALPAPAAFGKFSCRA